MSSINKAINIGRLTKDVEVRKTQSGVSVAKFTIACDRPGQKDAEKQADFIPCIAWRGVADFLGSYGKKGALLGVEGRLTSGSYKDRDGKMVYTLEVSAERVELLSRTQAQEQARQENRASYEPPVIQKQTEAPTYTPGAEITADDLPF